MRFTDARAAGRALAPKLETYEGREDTRVLALARGGVGVGLEVSKGLGLPLDLILLSRLLLPRGLSDPLCAASVAGTCFLDEELAPIIEAPRDPALGSFLADALAELDAHAHACRGVRAAVELKGSTVLLVDNGVRTGSTVRAAVRALRSTAPARVVVAVPVAAPEALASIEAVADELICLATPDPFGHVGLWYKDFTRPSDEEIRAMLDEAVARP
jgi:predicted phosphoribosyltransferase